MGPNTVQLALLLEQLFTVVFVHNIILKVLIERLKKVVSKLVDAQQMAFIKGREMMDAILTSNECVDVRKISKVQAFYASILRKPMIT